MGLSAMGAATHGGSVAQHLPEIACVLKYEAFTPYLPQDTLEGKGPPRRSQRRLDRRLEEVAKAVGGGYCRLQMLLKLALAVREAVTGHRLGVPEGGAGYPPPLLPMHL